MQEEKRKETEVVFGNPEEIDKRREQAKQFRTATERNYLLRDEYEKSRNLIDIMFMEGLPESFIEGIRLKKTDKADHKPGRCSRCHACGTPESAACPIPGCL